MVSYARRATLFPSPPYLPKPNSGNSGAIGRISTLNWEDLLTWRKFHAQNEANFFNIKLQSKDHEKKYIMRLNIFWSGRILFQAGIYREAFCGIDLESGRIMFKTLSPTGRIFMALQQSTCQVGGFGSSLNLLGGLLCFRFSKWEDYVYNFITNWEDFYGIAKE